jgi:YesN/AraC family two-component response regulator
VALSELVDRLLEKDPVDRPQSADEVIVELQGLRGQGAEPAKILFVDDEPSFERLIRLRHRAQVETGEMELSFARNGVEALEVLRADPGIRLVMTDLNMPKMDGLTLLDAIRGLDQLVLTVVISAYDDMSNIRKAMNLGAFDFLVKPIDFEDLDRTRKKALAEVRKHRQLQWLWEENRLLDERHRFLREAFARRLRGDPPSAVADAETVVEPPPLGSALSE